MASCDPIPMLAMLQRSSVPKQVRTVLAPAASVTRTPPPKYSSIRITNVYAGGGTVASGLDPRPDSELALHERNVAPMTSGARTRRVRERMLGAAQQLGCRWVVARPSRV